MVVLFWRRAAIPVNHTRSCINLQGSLEKKLHLVLPKYLSDNVLHRSKAVIVQIWFLEGNYFLLLLRNNHVQQNGVLKRFSYNLLFC